MRQKEGNKKYNWKWLAGILLLAALVMGIRLFLVESLHLSTDSMETSLHQGDFVLLDKTPFGKHPKRNAIQVFTSPLRKDSIHPPVFVSRCIALPGDTIRVTSTGYQINGKEYPHSPQAQASYFMANQGKDTFIRLLKKLPERSREWKVVEGGITCVLTSFEAYQIKEERPKALQSCFRMYASPEYQFIVPQKDRAYALDSLSLLACREAIQNETNGNAVFKDGKLFIEGKQMNFFFFRQNYYWFLSDYRDVAIDSRHLGIIPEDHIIGRIFFCWYSPDKNNRFTLIK